MGNILAFLAKYHRFFFFLLLEIICFSLVVSFNTSQNSTFVGVSNELAGRVYKAYNNVDQYFHLKREKDSLAAENTRLRAMLKASHQYDTSHAIQKEDTVFKQKFTYLPAVVVNNRVTARNNFMTLDIGSAKGSQRQAGVVTTAGIVGITKQVSSNFTSVLSVLHSDFTVSAEIAELKEIGSVTWDGKNPERVILKDIPVHIRVKKGMHVVTSPYSSVFPQGTTIGTIVQVIDKPDDAFHTIYVKLAADIRNVRQVYLITNLLREEQEIIEKNQEE
jgi:rod shape-determining protein MreC